MQAQVASRLERLGFPALRPAHIQLLSAIAAEGVRLAELVSAVSLPKQTVGDLIDDLESMRMVERFPDPDHGVIKRVRLGPKGKVCRRPRSSACCGGHQRLGGPRGLWLQEDEVPTRAARGAGRDGRRIARWSTA